MKTQVMVNGIDTERAFATIEAIKKDPSLAKFEFRARNEWVDGGTNRSTIQGFYGAGREDDSRQEPFVFTNGEPPVLLGDNRGANPVEFLLHALAGCVTTTVVLHAAARGIAIRRLSTKLVGDIDLRGLLDLNGTVTPGYQGIDVEMDIDADCSAEEIDDLLAFAHAHSPTVQTIVRPVQVTLTRKTA